ncbi:PKD domain-containing protein [Ferruginibacter yonginensis]|uniref:PKD domain-containing protein n=1 Tax=Ferruginibacter yonginensis TaxID=1310416 RepID=A0ABV8QRD0_9BACT
MITILKNSVAFIVCTLLLLIGNDVKAQLNFVQNKGQWDNSITYKTDFINGSFSLQNKGFSVLLHKEADMNRITEFTHPTAQKNPKVPQQDSFTIHSFVYNVRFLGASDKALLQPEKPQSSYNNYFIGNDPSKWASNCKIYNAITYQNIYPNIDVRYYTAGDALKYDFIVRPGGNPALIALRYDGVTGLQIKNKALIITTPVGDVTEMAPYSYQATTAGSKDVATKYVLRDNVVTFKVDDYDPSATLIIDPQLIFSSLTGSTVDNWGYTATPGPDGSFYAGGIAFGTGYPTSPGAYQTTFNGGSPEGDFGGVDMAIFKFSPNGQSRLYATYLGGNGNEQPHSMITDAAGNLVIAGRSNSANYPRRTAIPATGANYDIVVTKLNAAGNALIGSVKMGGSADDGVNIRPKYLGALGAQSLRQNYGDDARSEVILDAANNVILASCTQSTNFPVFVPAQATARGAQDGVILKFAADLNSIIFSTYFGGTGNDACFVAAVSPTTGNIFIGGATESTNLNGSTGGTIGTTAQGGIDGFVTVLPPNGGTFLRTTYLGTNADDLVYGLKIDRAGFPYVMGTTKGNWPVLNAAYSVPGAKQFISKLQPDLSNYVYSTIFGKNAPSPSISPIAFLVDRCENVYVSGWGGGINNNQNYQTGNTANLPEIDPLPNIPQADGADFYLFVLRKDAQNQLFGSHFGQFGGLGDHVDGGTSRFDANGIIYQALCANCGGRVSTPPVTFPTTPGAWARLNGSSACNEAAVKIDMNFSGVGAQIQSEANGIVNDTIGCVPFAVNFQDLIRKGVTYYWNFNSSANPTGVDQTTTVPQTSFTFNTPGTFVVRLIAEDLNTCNLRDTSYITINAGTNRVIPSFTKRKLDPCTSSTYEFTNTSTSTAGSSFTGQSFVWDYGDGSPKDTAGLTPVRTHVYPGPGTYIVKLFVIDPRFCNAPDSLLDTLRINPLVDARPSAPALGCAPFTAPFSNNSLGGLSWQWDFGDPASGAANSSTAFAPTHVYQNVGTYRYRLIAFDSTTCNKVDTSEFFEIKIVPKPQALASWGPNPPQVNVPVSFSNFSTAADTYLWIFGDGETSTAFAPKHEYNSTGFFDAKLVAFSVAGCSDTFNLRVETLINPLLDVPNAFTPGRFGENAVVTVRGFGIGKMLWRIYNRWGQLIFESTSKKQGWDGTYKGKLQPNDVYTYTLDAELTDGRKVRKTGDITLLR